MRIGFFFAAAKNHGGVYQYTITLLESLVSHSEHQVIIYAKSPDIPSHFSKHKNVSIVKLFNAPSPNTEVTQTVKFTIDLGRFLTRLIGSLSKILYILHLYPITSLLERFLYRGLIKIINSQSSDIVIFPVPSSLCLYIKPKIIVSIHDLQHRINPAFPEVALNGRWQEREYLYANLCKKAKVILADSDIGKADIINYYPVNPKNIIVLPYLPPSYLKASLDSSKKVINQFGIKSPYLFYPANYWPHKNHINLLKSLVLLHKHSLGKIPLVFTGTEDVDFSTGPKIKSFIQKHQLKHSVFQLGYVSQIELAALYKASLALIMPTYFGPSNIPILEAWKMGTPVIYSNIRGCREQLGDAGLLINPDSPKDIAGKIGLLLHNPLLRQSLISKGNHRLRMWTKTKFRQRVNQMINNFDKI